jgi:hypothetical protein
MNRLQHACERELERYIEELFRHPRMISPTLAEVPVVGGLFIVDLEHGHLLPRVTAALVARERFRQDVPGWPELPLRWEDCQEMQDDDDPKARLLGFFGESLASTEPDLYDYEGHPRFPAFAAGLLAYEATPLELRNDRAMQRRFPPQRLEGLCDGRMVWRSRQTIARDRDVMARVAAMVAGPP